MSSLHIGENVPLLDVERHTLYTEYRVSPIHTGENAPPPSLYRGASVFSTSRRGCPCAISRGGRSLLLTKEGMSCLYRRESFPMPCVDETYREENALFPYKAESVPLLDVGRQAPSLYRRESVFYKWSRETLLVAKESVSLFPIARMTYSFSLHMRVCSSSPQRG